MAVKDLVTLRNDIRAAMPDNVAGQIDAVDVRETGFIDTIDSLEAASFGSVATIADLRAFNAASIPADTVFFIRGHTLAGIGAGLFQLNKAGNVGANFDDGGVTVHAAGGPPVTDAGAWYWHRLLNESGQVTPQMFGAQRINPSEAVSSAFDSGPAFQAWLTFLTSGKVGSLAWSQNFPATGYCPAGVYQTNQPLTLDANANRVGIKGANRSSSWIRAGAAMPHILQISTTGGTFQDQLITDMGFDGMDLAERCIDASESRFWSFERNHLRYATTALFRGGQWASRINNNLLDGRNIAGTEVATGLELIGPLNAVTVRENAFTNCVIGADVIGNPAALGFYSNSWDVCTGAAIVWRAGCRTCEVSQTNKFEGCGDDGVDVEVSSGVFERWYGVFIATPPFNNLVGDAIQGLKIHGNTFSRCSLETLLSIRSVLGLEWRDNFYIGNRAARSAVALQKEGAEWSSTAQVRIEQVSSDNAISGLSIVSADPGTNTLTLNLASDMVRGVPFRALGGSLPAGMTDGRIYFPTADVRGTTTVKVSETIGGPEVDITATGTGTFRRLSQFAQLVNLENITDVNRNAAGLIIRDRRNRLTNRGSWISGNRSLGGNPAGWPINFGTSVVTLESTPYEDSPVWRVSGNGARQLDITIEQEYWSMRGSAWRLRGLSKGDGGAGGARFEFAYDNGDGSGLRVAVVQSIASTVWDEFQDQTFWIPWDAQTLRFRFSSSSGTTDCLFTRFSLAPAALEPEAVPIAFDSPV